MKTSSEPARSRPGSSCGDSREDERHPRPHSFNNMCSNWIATSVEPHHKSGNLDPQVSRESEVNVTAGPVHFAVNAAIVPETPLPKWSTPVNPVLNGANIARFCRTFEWNVESNTNDPRRRLTQLYNQLDGPPKDLIEGCLHLPPDHGYDEAWRMLREEYENSSELLESFISKLFAWKDIEVGDAEGLKKYGSYLFNVEMALGDNICRMELRETISKILMLYPVLIFDCEPDGRIMMKILPVRVNNSVSTYAFIDGGAAPTLAARSLIQRLGIQGLPVRQAMKTENGIFMCNERVPLMLSSIGGGNNITVNEVYITDKLSITTDSMMPVNWTKKWLHLNDVDLQRLPGDNQEVELIIGLNSILNRHILDQRHGTDDEPSAYLTRFGWVVFGPTGPRNPLTAPVYHISPTQDLGECLREHFNADFWEKEVHSQREDSLEDKLFSDKISQSIHQESGKYVVKLPSGTVVHFQTIVKWLYVE
ncbi:WDFY family member 4 [Penaeus vannamei]|uniref:WDFY family member 4 n=1 Tax=Penaeus vannamei TaxID=6689 RepID=A0A3R7M6X9_PENVA|nr:WDFY family member 4 [Penaeus vannamei]